jgi:hypothetical protein
VYYFAYGSNMSLNRLRQRVPGAQRITACLLPGHALRFHKVGRDGSAKCDAFHTGRACDRVLGALFSIDPQHKYRLDRAEGLGGGYEEKPVVVLGTCGTSFSASTYYATHIDPQLRPYSWYLQHVVLGARETALPLSYQSGLAAVACIEDPVAERDSAERTIHLGVVAGLEAAGTGADSVNRA